MQLLCTRTKTQLTTTTGDNVVLLKGQFVENEQGY